MSKDKKDKPDPKVILATDFNETMRLLAAHANAVGTKKVTYGKREKAKK